MPTPPKVSPELSLQSSTIRRRRGLGDSSSDESSGTGPAPISRSRSPSPPVKEVIEVKGPPTAPKGVVIAHQAPPLTLPLRRPPFAHRNTETNDLVHRAGLVRFPTRMEIMEEEEVRPPRPSVFGMRTRYKPLWLLGMGALGNSLYGTGTVAIERGIWPRRPVLGIGQPREDLPPEFQALFGHRGTSIGVGSAATMLGAIMAVTSCVLFYQDARRLARKSNPANPSFTRPNAYFAAHLTAIALSIGYKFLVEAIRDTVPRDYTWASAVPGLIGQALFAVTQAQAFSSCELQNGKMPLKYRAQIGFAARFCIGFQSLYGVMQGVPYLSQYAKEVVRLFSVTAATLAYSLPLTTARIETQARRITINDEPATDGPTASWYAMNVLGIYAVGRMMAGFGPDLLQRGIFIAAKAETSTNPTAAMAGNSFGGAFLGCIGTGLCVAAIMLYREDVNAYSLRKANTLAGLACGALLAIEVYRGLLEYGLNSDMRHLVWVAIVPGIIGTGLRLAVLPELFCFSELLNGDLPLRARYQWTEASRAAAQLCFGVWGSMSGIPDFDPFVREAVGVSAGLLATLGMALPTTTSRRTLPQYAWPLSPGATPRSERGNPFDV